MSISILSLPKGQPAALDALEGEAMLTERLLDMGLHPGVEVELVERMPFRGPVIVRAEASIFALREEEAQCLKIKS